MNLVLRRLWAAVFAVALVALFVTGCDRQETASNQPGAQQPADRESETQDDGPVPDDSDEPAVDAPAPAAKAATVPTPDVPLPPTVDGEAAKAGFVFFTAKDSPKNVAAFYQKEMEAKGWKIGRNESKTDPGLASVVQQYAKGNEVLTVLLQEQIGSEKNFTAALILDFQLPPTAKQVVPILNAVTLTTPEPQDATLAWFARELGARGWTAQSPATSGGMKTQSHKKGGRSVNVITTVMPGNRGTSVHLQHVAYAG